MTTYTRDDQLAVQPETAAGGRIETSGAYVGRFTLAKERVAKTGTKGIEFNFEAEDGRVARYLTLWLQRANGERIEYPFSLLSALLACLDLKSIDSSPAQVDEWNIASGTWEPATVQAFPTLLDKTVGVVLQREEREWEGKTYVGMKIVEFFRPKDRATPAELLSGSQPGQALEKLLGNLKETVVRQGAPASGAPGAGFVDIDEDDVPF